MELRCKKGDIAYDLTPGCGEYYGRICTVGEFVGECDTVEGPSFTDAWEVSFGDEAYSPDGHKWICPDMYLLPIRPNELKEEEEREVTA